MCGSDLVRLGPVRLGKKNSGSVRFGGSVKILVRSNTILEHSERIDMNATTTVGSTAFMWACRNGHKDVVELLLE